MKKITLLALFVSTALFSQVGVGTTAPNAQLDVIASNQAAPSEKDGILIPRINEFPATNPSLNQDGMVVFVTGDGAPKRGFYYWNKTSWKPFVRKINDLEDGKSNETSVLASVYLGVGAGASEGGAKSNVGVGQNALNKVIGGSGNVAIGMLALRNNTSYNNTAVGKNAAESNTGGLENVAVGYLAFCISVNTHN